VEGSVPVTCVPASGSTFAIGTTTVICTAKDSATGESASAKFTITVTQGSPEDRLAELIGDIQGSHIPPGLRYVLTSLLSQALANLNSPGQHSFFATNGFRSVGLQGWSCGGQPGRVGDACSLLAEASFIIQVDPWQIPPWLGYRWTAAIRDIEVSLDCGGFRFGWEDW
jgi:hypothetical protein